jgi:hypothetical protein
VAVVTLAGRLAPRGGSIVLPGPKAPIVQRLPPAAAPLYQAGGLGDQSAWLYGGALDVIAAENAVIDRMASE